MFSAELSTTEYTSSALPNANVKIVPPNCLQANTFFRLLERECKMFSADLSASEYSSSALSGSNVKLFSVDLYTKDYNSTALSP
jgi:hypothetical protein